MKRIMVVLMVLSMATMANAVLKISVNGDVDLPDTQVNLRPSETVALDIWGDGQTPSPIGDLWLLVQGPGTVSGPGALHYPVPASEVGLHTGDAYTTMIQGIPGFETVNQGYKIAFVDFTIPPAPLAGVLLDGITLHSDAPGDVLLTLATLIYDDIEGTWAVTTYDTQVIHIPEPMTMGLLGLGGLFLRRRSK